MIQSLLANYGPKFPVRVRLFLMQSRFLPVFQDVIFGDSGLRVLLVSTDVRPNVSGFLVEDRIKNQNPRKKNELDHHQYLEIKSMKRKISAPFELLDRRIFPRNRE